MARGHHFRADGGKIDSYTNTPNNVEEEAAGKRRADGGAAPAANADGGAAASAPAARKRGGKAMMGRFPDAETPAEEKAEEGMKRGGSAKKHVDMEGTKTKHRRLDRPGRKRGGGVGADMTPLSSAARTTAAGAHKADNDELAD